MGLAGTVCCSLSTGVDSGVTERAGLITLGSRWQRRLILLCESTNSIPIFTTRRKRIWIEEEIESEDKNQSEVVQYDECWLEHSVRNIIRTRRSLQRYGYERQTDTRHSTLDPRT
ncbi:hypothetical protein PV326_010129, partial [Microctonus aethiopoides]